MTLSITHQTVATDPQTPRLGADDWNATHTITGTVDDGDLGTGINANKIADGSVTNTEFQYLGGVTSDIQTQLNAKGDVNGPSSSTDHSIARFDGTGGKTIQDYTSGAPTIGDTGAVAVNNTLTVTSNSATAFTVGPNGATNPCLTIAANTASADCGVTITGGTNIGTIAATGNDTNVSLTLISKGNGTTAVATGSGGVINLQPSGTTRYQAAASNHTFSVATSTSTSVVRFEYTGGADTSLTAGNESNAVYFNIGQTRQHASNTAITTQRDFLIAGSTHSFASSGGVITNYGTLSLTGGLGGTNSTLTHNAALYVPTWTASNSTNAYALRITAPSGATNNYAMSITGNNLLDGDIRVDSTPTADHTANGPVVADIDAGAAITIMQLVYLASDGEWALADADAASTSSGMLGIALATGSDNAPMLTALPGSFVRDDTWNWTPGAILYVSTTAGDITATAPSATGDIVRVIGYAVTADVIFFMPSGSWVEIA